MILFQFPGIKGQTNAGDYKDCVLINSVDFSIGRRGKNVNRGSARDFGTKMCEPILLSKNSDDSSRQIISQSLLCTVADAKIYFLETGNRCYLQLELTDCVINEIKFSCHGNDKGHETFYLTFKTINYRTLPLLGQGSPSGTGFNLQTGEGA